MTDQTPPEPIVLKSFAEVTATPTSPEIQPEPTAPIPLPVSASSKAGLWFLSVLILFSVTTVGILAWTPDKETPNEPQTAAAATVVDTSAFDGLVLEAKSAYVLDLATSNVLFSKNADTQLPLASITKVALVLAASEVLASDDVITISRGAIQRGEGGGLGTGDEWRVQDLIDFTLIVSSNSGAEALAESADAELLARYPHAEAGKATVFRMNALAEELGLTKTYFLNPSGLDVSTTQAGAMGSTRDVATLLAYVAMHNRAPFTGTADRTRTLGPLNGEAKPANNTNDALSEIPGLILGKTGYTDLAGGNLGIVFEVAPGHIVVAVVMGSSDAGRFEDMKKLVETSRKTLGIKAENGVQ